MNRSGRLVAAINSVTEIEEVFVAKIASFFTIPSSESYISFFICDVLDDGFDHDVAIRHVLPASSCPSAARESRLFAAP